MKRELIAAVLMVLSMVLIVGCGDGCENGYYIYHNGQEEFYCVEKAD